VVVPPGATLEDARRLAREDHHREAVEVLDALLATRPDDVHCLAARGYSRVFVLPLDESAARSDLERALALAASDTHLAAMIEFNLGLLEDHALHGSAAREHYARANELHPSRAARERSQRECVVDARADEDPRAVQPRDWLAIARAFSSMLDARARPSEEPSDAAAAERALCASDDGCAWDAPFALTFDEGGIASTGAVIPLPDGRVRVIAPMAEGERNIRCSAELAGAARPDGAVTTSAVRTGVGDDDECHYDTVETAHAFVDPASSHAIVVLVIQSGLDTLARPSSPVTVERTTAGVHVRGCEIDAEVPFTR
jgi:hypothetical protein